MGIDTAVVVSLSLNSDLDLDLGLCFGALVAATVVQAGQTEWSVVPVVVWVFQMKVRLPEVLCHQWNK